MGHRHLWRSYINVLSFYKGTKSKMTKRSRFEVNFKYYFTSSFTLSKFRVRIDDTQAASDVLKINA